MGRSLKVVERELRRRGLQNVVAREFRESVVLTGQVESWNQKIEAGYAAAKTKKYKGVVNDITVPGVVQDQMSMPQVEDDLLEGRSFDAVVVGGGITGCAIARELCRYGITVALLEKESDLAMHASSRNDGMIHPGLAARPGSKKAYYNVRGNAAYTQVAEELKVPFHRPGSLMLLKSPIYRVAMPFIKMRAKKNGVPGVRYVSKKEVAEMEPNVGVESHGGILMPTAGQLSPYRLTIAYAENAVENGAEVFLDTAVTALEKEGSAISRVVTNRGTLKAGVVINAAGVWADHLAELADDRFFSIHYRKGVDAILDLKTKNYQSHMMAMPDVTQRKSTSKGGGLVMTIEGNILVGPTAFEQSQREDYSTTASDLDNLGNQFKVNKKISRGDVITYFAGIRACTYEEDFVIEPSSTVDNLVYAAGIQSPGLASAPAIAEDVSKMAVEVLRKTKQVDEREDFQPVRQSARADVRFMAPEERASLIKEDPTFGKMVCRCEEISEGEIRAALRSPIPVKTVDGIKRRARTGTGRCHGGFCTPRVMEIMADELGVSMTELTKKGHDSHLLNNETKGQVVYDLVGVNAGGEVE